MTILQRDIKVMCMVDISCDNVWQMIFFFVSSMLNTVYQCCNIRCGSSPSKQPGILNYIFHFML